jgi:hypothetical protein
MTEVATDNDGLDPAALEEILSTWKVKRPNQRFPKLLYTMYAFLSHTTTPQTDQGISWRYQSNGI